MPLGSFGGTTTRWVRVAVGLSPLVLAWTGVSMWLRRRHGRRHARHDETEAGTDPADPDPSTVTPQVPT